MRAFHLAVLATVVAFAWSASGQVASPEDSGARMHRYNSLIERVLPCEDRPLRGTTDFYLCVRVIPSGHDLSAREFLARLSSSGGKLEIVLIEPDQPLWESTSAIGRREIRIRTFKTAMPEMIDRIAGRSRTENLLTEVIPLSDWYVDATTYVVRSRAVTGSLDLEMQGPGPSSKRKPSRLISWIERVRERGEVCVRGRASVLSVVPNVVE